LIESTKRLGLGVQVRPLRRQLEAPDAHGAEHRTERLGELRIAVVDQVALASQELIDTIDQVARHLLGPRIVRMANQAGDVPGRRAVPERVGRSLYPSPRAASAKRR
jgi:hypothetical protein